MEQVIYSQPTDMKGLAEALEQATDKTVLLGGGTDLLIMIRKKHPSIDRYISLGKIPELEKIEEQEGFLKIGAMATHRQIAGNPLVKKYFPALSMACSHVGSQQIRNKGTIGGSLANASPAGDMMPCVFLFEGEIEIYNKNQEYRRISGEEFLIGNQRTSLSLGEAVSALWLPIREERKSCFVKLGARTDVTIAQISLALSWEKKEKAIESVRAYLGAVDVRPLYLPEAEELLSGEISREKKDALAESLRDRIQGIRERRKRQPKLRITEAERLYKERAVKGIVYDAAEYMEES